MRTLLAALAVLVATAAAPAAVPYADVYARVAKGEVVLVAVGVEPFGDHCVRLADPPPEKPPGVYVCFLLGDQPRMRRVDVAVTEVQSPPPQPPPVFQPPQRVSPYPVGGGGSS